VRVSKQIIKTLNKGAVLLFLIQLSCAQIVPLTGGEKDITSPKNTGNTPENESINFSDKKITIEFDEFIRLNNLQSQLVVSPIMETSPTIMANGKKLIIKINEQLSPNTTYSFNFGDAIVDLTENNPVSNFNYVFSTGSFIDSLSFSGNIKNAFSLAPQEGYVVMLYKTDLDSLPLTQLPDYISKTDKDGKFNVTNISHGKFKVFALKDINSNYLYDLPTEHIAFYNNPIEIDSSVSENIFYSFKEDNELQYIKSSNHTNYGTFSFEFNKPFQKLNVKPLNHNSEDGWFLGEGDEDHKTSSYWITGTESLDELTIEVSDSNTIIDTVNFDLVRKEDMKDSLLSISTNLNSSFDLNKNVTISIKNPFVSYSADSIKLFEDSTLVTSSYLTDISLRKFELSYDFKENTKYYLKILPNAFTDIFGLKNDTVIKSFTTKQLSDYGTIKLDLTPGFDNNYILQLINAKGDILHEDFIIGSKKIDYSFLSPGNYQLKIILDNNNNKKWDSGNYTNKVQPESIYIYNKPITIRANWDNEIKWDLTTK